MNLRHWPSSLSLFVSAVTWVVLAAQPAQTRVALFVVDDITSPVQLLDALPSLFRELEKSGWVNSTRLGLVTSGPSSIVLDLGAPPAAIVAALEKVAKSKATKSTTAPGAPVALSMLSSIAGRLNRIEVAEKIVIFVAGRYDVTPEVIKAVAQVTEAMRAGRTRVIMISEETSPPEGMARLPIDTAGTLVSLENGPIAAAKAISTFRPR
jgi:hypothetical protein